MEYIKGIERNQIILFPESVDDYISKDNPVKFIEAFVDNLDLAKLGFGHSQLKGNGRPPYDPADMLKLYIYGYLNKIRTSRTLETETKRNLELIWLLKKLSPDDKTIANFRKDNLKAIKQVCREFTLLCKKLDLFGAELVAIDGSKFRAQNSKKRNFNRSKLKRSIKAIDDRIEAYLKSLDKNDDLMTYNTRPSAQELEEKIRSLKSKKTEYKKLLTEMKTLNQEEISLTDPDSRAMMNKQRVEICYNTQIAVDAKHKLIASAEVINNPADQGRLSDMAKEVKETLNAKDIKVVADKGYYDSKDIKECMDSNITPLVAKPKRTRPKKDNLFSKDEFIYNHEKDIYVCPAKLELTYNKTMVSRDKTMFIYTTNRCKDCRLKHKCTKAKQRTISRWEHEDILEEMELRMQADPQIIKQRQWLVEHPFGTIKRSFNQGYMLLRGLDKVRCEFSLSVLAYNIKRVINIMGIEAMIAATTG